MTARQNGPHTVRSKTSAYDQVHVMNERMSQTHLEHWLYLSGLCQAAIGVILQVIIQLKA